MISSILSTVDDDVLYPERAWLVPFLRPSLPRDWRPIQEENVDSVAWQSKDGLRVMLSGQKELDGRRWIHLSVSFPRRTRIPTHADLTRVKNLFLGKNTKAIQLFVPEEEHVNFCTNCLHLWHCLDGDGLPDFRVRSLGMVMV